MFAAIPLGVEGGEVRFPIAGLGILVTCLALFGLTWLAEPSPMGTDDAKTEAAVTYWAEHPYLEFPATFSKQLLPKGGRELLRGVRERWHEDHRVPESAAVDAQQSDLDALCDDAVAAIRPTLFRLLALDATRGPLQPGWLTYMFLHAGWMHLIGNMLFLYVVALLLEDAWGRGLFLLFYLAGGVLSGAAEFLLKSDGALVLVGASGAVSACIGAAMVRFATRKMRIGYFFFFRFGTFSVPVWLWGVFKAGSEVWDLTSGQTQGVAVLAHVVGLAFGVGVALVMRTAGLDTRLKATDELPREVLAPSFSREAELGHDALARRDRAAARQHFENARLADPDDVDALTAVVAMEVHDHRQIALTALERLVTVLLRTSQSQRATQVVVETLQTLPPRDLRAAFAAFLAKTLGEGLPRPMAHALWLRAADEPGPGAPLAILTAVELALQAHEVEAATAALRRLDVGTQNAGVRERIERAKVRLRELGGRFGEPAQPQSEEVIVPVIARRRQTLPVSVMGAEGDGMLMQAHSGQARLIRSADIKCVAAGFVSSRDLRRVLVVYLILDWGAAGRPALMLRLDSDTGAVEKLHPELESRAAWLQFLSALVKDPGVFALPDAQRLTGGHLPFCADLATLEESLFGALPSV